MITIEDLNAKVSSMYDEVSIACEKLKACDAEISAIKTALDMLEKYKTNKPVYDKLCTIKKKAISDKFKEDHHGELSLFYMARRMLDELYPEGYPKAKDLKARLEALDGRHIFRHDVNNTMEQSGMSDASKGKAIGNRADTNRNYYCHAERDYVKQTREALEKRNAEKSHLSDENSGHTQGHTQNIIIFPQKKAREPRILKLFIKNI